MPISDAEAIAYFRSEAQAMDEKSGIWLAIRHYPDSDGNYSAAILATLRTVEEAAELLDSIQFIKHRLEQNRPALACAEPG